MGTAGPTRVTGLRGCCIILRVVFPRSVYENKRSYSAIVGGIVAEGMQQAFETKGGSLVLRRSFYKSEGVVTNTVHRLDVMQRP